MSNESRRLRRAVCGSALALLTGTLWAPRLAGATPTLPLAEVAARLSGGGWLLMMRHAQTEPGIGDPPGFRLDDCSTQRNLSAAGRDQARRAGEAIRAAGIRLDEVRNSRWCRCRDTATLAFGASSDWSAIDSFFASRGNGAAQTAEVVQWAATIGTRRNVMLVTHQVNIGGVMGTGASQGEVIVGRWNAGRVEPAFGFLPGSP
jgi:phosphohistidine phosphatase SixA